MADRLESPSVSPRIGAPRWLGVVVLLAIALHAATKAGDGKLWEMLWACHVATTLLGLGILAGSRRVVGIGFLFHLAIGCPAFLLDVIATQTTTPTSVLVHGLPLLAGGLVVARCGLPPRAPLVAWICYLALQLVSYGLTDPALNINLAHAAWEPMARVFPGVWAARLMNAAMALTFLAAAAAIVRCWRPQVRCRASRSLPSNPPQPKGDSCPWKNGMDP